MRWQRAPEEARGSGHMWHDEGVTKWIACRAVLSTCAVVVLMNGSASASRDHTEAPRETAERARDARALPLRIVSAPTPRFRVARYDTEGTYVQVRDRSLDLSRVNAALRQAILADQRAYAPSARRYATDAQRYRGVYATSVDRRLLSASTVVVSALMPAVKLYPGGNEGRGWVSATVRVPSAKAVQITDLFARPTRGLRALALAWKARIRGTPVAACVRIIPSSFRPTAHNYRFFALTARGLAIGFWQPPACDRLHATIPYAVLRPHFSELGATLIRGVQPAR